MIVCGIDIGSTSTKAALMMDGKLEAYSIIRTGPDSAQSAREVLSKTLSQTEIRERDIAYTVATGYGRFIVPFADRNITEISCHTKGAHYFFPSVRTILDMGGQDCKAIQCDGNGKVTNFIMNDKCAAGTGRAFDVMARLLQVKLKDIGPFSLDYEGEPVEISKKCIIFAKSEVLSHMREGTPLNQILAGLCEGVADRVKGLVRRVGIKADFVTTGGITKNIGVVQRIEEKLGVKSFISPEPQIVGAVGAAIFAREIMESGR